MPLRRASATPHLSRIQGITLVEVAISGFILAMLSGALAITLGSSLRRNAAVAAADQAREEARAKLEEIVTWPAHDQIPAQFHGTTFPVGALENPSGPGDEPGTVTIDASNPGLLLATVRVDWVGTLGEENLEFRTFLSKRLAE